MRNKNGVKAKLTRSRNKAHKGKTLKMRPHDVLDVILFHWDLPTIMKREDPVQQVHAKVWVTLQHRLIKNLCLLDRKARATKTPWINRIWRLVKLKYCAILPREGSL